MSQFLSQIPRQLLQQQQRMMPQLIQAMDILQLNALALESRIEQEMDSNPALEIAEPEPELLDDGQKPDEQPAESTEDEQAMIVKEDDLFQAFADTADDDTSEKRIRESFNRATAALKDGQPAWIRQKGGNVWRD